MKAQSQAFVATGKDIVDLAEGFQHLEYIISSDADAGHAETPKWGKSLTGKMALLFGGHSISYGI